jgi:acetyltransferase-like isoleucine patch superfamily enzyme
VGKPASPRQEHKALPKIMDEERSVIARYQEIALGRAGWFFLLKYELTMLLCNGLSGAAGLWLRRKLYPKLLGKVGRGVVFGQDISLRHPGRIEIGDCSVVDDGCVLDARSEEPVAISIGTHTILARDTIVACKGGTVQIGDHVGVGAHTTIHCCTGNRVEIGNKVLIGPYCYIVGAGLYRMEQTDVPILEQGLDLRGGVTVGDNVWLGAHSTILDGVTISNDAVVGAGAVVTKDVPPFAIVAGIPAKIVRNRKDSLTGLQDVQDCRI